MSFQNANMFNKDYNSATIILPLPKLNSPNVHNHPPHHNSLWDYKFTAQTTSNNNTPVQTTRSESSSPSPSPIDQQHQHYTLHTPIPQQPLILPSISTLPTTGPYDSPLETTSITPPSQSSSRSHSIVSTHKINKPQRKKKECPECHLFFSNLSTHKSIHLTPENRPYLCKICGRGFARSNDLFRHNKRHWKETGSSQGAFKCPFSSVLYNQSYPNHQIQDPPCHATGIFSRCDTYKNHLKALHFEYPQGTKKKNRMEVGGCCKKCGKYFENVDVWLNTHVENNECGWNFD